MRPIYLFALAFLLFGIFNPGSAQEEERSRSETGYRIDAPGTITFTVGVKIKGKVEKPQVVIFLPKEKPHYREVDFERSFKKELMESLPFEPVEVP
ncbi:MAG: hypothetical protein GF401_07250 [Chitinivibrionales bacterium]|nr:hypothetical protein [Chitinivibrionales bacterium]